MNAFQELKRLTLIATAILFFGFVVLPGCKPASDGTLDLLDTKLSSIKIDDLARTMDFVFSDKRFDQDEFVKAVTLGLNRWVRAQPQLFENSSWTLDPLVAPLSEKFGDMSLVIGLPEMNFVNTDAFFLQQSAWLNNIAQRITADTRLYPFELQRMAAGEVEISEDGDPLATILGQLNAELSNEDGQQLARGMRCFDWVIRNIQLDPDPEPSDDELTPALGAKRFPWQVLNYSRGDYVERAKLFMLLTQQAGLDAVMLYVGEGDTAKPWCPALLVGGKLYLFETKLGMPIPAEKPGSIATLAEIKNKPDLLKYLDLTTEESLADETEYWIKGEDLQTVQALIYTSPETASRRMYELEKHLTKDYRLSLSSRLTDISEKLPKIDGMSHAAWDIGFHTHKFRSLLREAVVKSSTNDVIADKIRWHFLEESYIDEFSVYRTARARYFNGRFDVDSQRRTAIESFDTLMYQDKQIADLATDTFLQRQVGIRKEKGQDVQSYQQQLRSIQERMRLVRRDAGIFLAQCHFDKGNVSAASNWLKRMLDKPDSERWQTGVEYLLARACESMGEHDDALYYYTRSKGSPQIQGNLIRARMLKSFLPDS